MIYSNEKFRPQEKTFSWGTLTGITLGEKGRGRDELFIPCETEVSRGMNEGLNVVLSRRGLPKIIRQSSSELFLIINTYGGYRRYVNGYIHNLASLPVTVIASGQGAWGGAGRLGNWQHYVLRVLSHDKPFWIEVRTSGRAEYQFLYVNGTEVTSVPLSDLELFCDVNDIAEPE